MSGSLNIRNILDDIVHQFSEPLAFFRELVQNSIDAGTSEIEIELSYEGQPSSGRGLISLKDWGEGMNREIIETKLVRLFSSGKDEDFTKIGRFGIGFVSVFAINPEAVVVDTGRDGEYWRVLFSKDRTYELFALDEPVEGTHIQIFQQISAADFEALRPRAKEIIVKWCKHVSVPLYFEGEDIREPFAISSRLQTTYEEEGTRVVIGFTHPARPFAGYYNRGLTLNETHATPFPLVSFKIDSRYLEHTLTRDQIIEDGHFEKASRILDHLANTVLPEKLIDVLEADATGETLGEDYDHHCQYLALFLGPQRSLPRAWRQRKLFRTIDGIPLSSTEVQRAARRRRILLARSQSSLTRAFESKHLILAAGPGDGLANLCLKVMGEPVGILEDDFFLLSEIAPPTNPNSLQLQQGMKTLLEAASLYIDVVIAEGGDLPPLLRQVSGAIVAQSSEPIEVDDHEVPDLDHMHPEVTLIVNASTPELARLIGLAGREPEYAALMALKIVTAFGAPDPPREDALLRAAVGARARRLEVTQ